MQWEEKEKCLYTAFLFLNDIWW